MNPTEIKARLDSIPTPYILNNLLAFNSWVDPDDFYTMGVKGRRLLKERLTITSDVFTASNKWIWFGAYSTKGQPRFVDHSVPSFLYQVLIKPSNQSRLRPMVTIGKSDVNPFKYCDSMKASSLDIAHHRSKMNGETLLESVLPNDKPRIDKLLAECMEDYNTYADPSITTDELRNMLISLNHPPTIIDEVFKLNNSPKP